MMQRGFQDFQGYTKGKFMCNHCLLAHDSTLQRAIDKNFCSEFNICDLW